MKKNVELMNLFWTHAGIFPGEGEISPFKFKDRVEAVAKAGFKGIGFWHTDLEHVSHNITLKEMKKILDDNGIKHIELEFLTDWFITGTRRNESDRRKKILFEASEVLNAKHIKVGDFYKTICPMHQIVEAFAKLCSEAENYGATIGFEFMPGSMLNSLTDSLIMVETAGAKNGGLILDTAHLMYLGIPYKEVSRIPLKYLINIELNDGTLPGSSNRDISRARRFCGEGEFDIKSLINSVHNIGYDGPWGVEVFSKELTALSLEALTTYAFKTTIAEFID